MVSQEEADKDAESASPPPPQERRPGISFPNRRSPDGKRLSMLSIEEQQRYLPLHHCPCVTVKLQTPGRCLSASAQSPSMARLMLRGSDMLRCNCRVDTHSFHDAILLHFQQGAIAGARRLVKPLSDVLLLQVSGRGATHKGAASGGSSAGSALDSGAEEHRADRGAVVCRQGAGHQAVAVTGALREGNGDD